MPSAPPADVLATFRGGVVELGEFELAGPPPVEASPSPGPGAAGRDWRREVVQSIALRKILAPEAPSDPQLQKRIRERRRAILGASLARELGWDALTVTEAEIRHQYESHPEQYRDPEKIRFQHIFFRAEAGEMSPQDRALVRTRLENLRAEVQGGADFDAMAREYSQSADSQSGGWGSLARGADVFDSFTDVAWSLEVNQLSEVIDTPNGFQILKLKERIPPFDRKFEDVKEFARKRALDAKLSQRQAAFVAEAGKRFGMVKRYERLEDPMVEDGAALISVAGNTLTMRELVDRLPRPLQEYLFNGFFPLIHRYLDKVALEELTALEAEVRGIASRHDVAPRLKLAEDLVRAQAALEERVRRRVAAVPEPELREFYSQNRRRYETTRRWDLDVIMLRPQGKETPWEVLKRAEALTARIRAGEDFADLARRYSKHYSARTGGRMEGLSDEEIAGQVQSTAKFRRMLQGLREGDVGDAMVGECYDRERLTFARTGAIIVRLVRLHPSAPRPFEEVRDLVANNYVRRNHQRLEEETKKAVLDSVAFRVYAERLPPL